MRLVFLDTETTGLDPRTHEVWEVAAIVRDTETKEQFEFHRFLPVDLSRADLIALNIGRFNERYDYEVLNGDSYFKTRDFCEEFMKLTWGAHIVGAVPNFDTERIANLMWNHGFIPAWHYHLVDVESLMAGFLAEAPPWKSSELSAKMGIPEPPDKHDAMVDAKWAMQIYDRIIGDNKER